MIREILSTSLFAFVCVVNSTAQRQFVFGTEKNPEGKTITVDSYGFKFDDSYVIPVMGEIHYSRVPEKDWQREIRKMKAGGITILSTYVFWNHHEAEEGKWDWSGNRNLRRFLEVCSEEGMPIVLRVGPFCHGEVYQGGFPTWIVRKASEDKDYKLRSNAPQFMRCTANLYNKIFAQVNGLLWKDGGPVVGMQIENECRGPWTYYAGLKSLALKAGFDLPFYTRTGWPKLNGKEVFGEMLPLYGDYADGFWDRKLTDMPGDYEKAFIMRDSRLSSVIATEALGTNQDTRMESQDMMYPYLTCELGGGMMPSYHRRINMSGKEAKPLAICKLGSGGNLPGYYMYHGGTNPYSDKHTMGETQSSDVTNYNDMPYMTYDFQSPLGEMGQMNETSFHECRFLHQMLSDWGGQLCTMRIDTMSAHYSRRGSFEFFNDYVRIKNEKGLSYVKPRNLKVGTAVIDWATAEPFCIASGVTYFIEIPGLKCKMSIDGKVMSPKLDKVFMVRGNSFCVLSRDNAKRLYKIDDELVCSKHDGIVFATDTGVVEEYWTESETYNAKPVVSRKVSDAKGLRTVKLGKQGVAAMPAEEDFRDGDVYKIEVGDIPDDAADDLFLKVCYKGDVARLYADGQLVQDNFWNGKPMLVRVSDIAGKSVELCVLPLSKDYPIYFQSEQRKEIDSAPNGVLSKLDKVSFLIRNVKRVK